jgi:hypothetical protein
MNINKPLGLVPESKFFEFGNILIEKNVIFEIRHHEDTLNLRDKLENLDTHDESHELIMVLAKMLFSPFLIDKIEETPENAERNKIKNDLKKENHELFVFYSSNKLESSNLVHSLTIVEMLNGSFLLGEDLQAEFDSIKLKFTGSKENFTASHYKKNLSNEEKLHMAYEVFNFIEKALAHFLEQVEKK